MPRVSSDELVYGDGLAIMSVQWPPDGSEQTALESMRTLHAAAGDASRVRFNDAKCDRRGRLVAGTMDLFWMDNFPPTKPAVGALYSVDPLALGAAANAKGSAAGSEKEAETRPEFVNGHLRLVDDRCIYLSNGITWSLDDRLLYFVDSVPRTISVYDYNVVTGEASVLLCALISIKYSSHDHTSILVLVVTSKQY